MSSCAILFARYPEAGTVKTRLRPAVGAAAAADLYRAFLVDSAATLATAAVDRRVVACAPAAAVTRMSALLDREGSFAYTAQTEGDLGERMAAALRSGLEAGATRVAVVGSDCPSLPPQIITDGLELLRRHDVVLGPSADGGYYLIGVRREEAGLFHGVAWSTGAVLAQTIAALRPGARLALLPPWYDVDTAADAAFLKAHLEALERAGERRAPRSLEALRRLDLPLPS